MLKDVHAPSIVDGSIMVCTTDEDHLAVVVEVVVAAVVESSLLVLHCECRRSLLGSATPNPLTPPKTLNPEKNPMPCTGRT